MKPTIPDVIARFATYRKDNPMWGSLHIVLEDGNVRDSDVEFCRHYATEQGDVEGADLAQILLTMSKTQRLRIDEKVDEYQESHGIGNIFKDPEPSSLLGFLKSYAKLED